MPVASNHQKHTRIEQAEFIPHYRQKAWKLQNIWIRRQEKEFLTVFWFMISKLEEFFKGRILWNAVSNWRWKEDWVANASYQFWEHQSHWQRSTCHIQASMGGCLGNFVTCVVSHAVSVLRHNYKDFLLFVLIHHGHKLAQLLILIFCYTSYQHEKG